jgi:PIN domain nuclease of toxin-antitoxin system
MKLLIDTHTFIWFCEDDKNLSATAKTEIEKIDNEVNISAVSLWELTIKL